MCVVTTREEAERRGLRPLLALRSWAVAGVGPEVMGIGPVPATAAALDRAGLTLDEIDLIELNEAFAAQVIACLREWKVDATDERLNPNGSGISLGHPVGATGARILATAAYEAPAPRQPLRARDHVHRWRPGPRRGLRGHQMSRPGDKVVASAAEAVADIPRRLQRSPSAGSAWPASRGS